MQEVFIDVHCGVDDIPFVCCDRIALYVGRQVPLAEATAYPPKLVDITPMPV